MKNMYEPFIDPIGVDNAKFGKEAHFINFLHLQYPCFQRAQFP